MKALKPIKVWALFEPDGRLVESSIRLSEQASKTSQAWNWEDTGITCGYICKQLTLVDPIKYRLIEECEYSDMLRQLDPYDDL